MEFSSRRRQDIEDHLLKDYDLLKIYEDERRLESDPQRRAKLDYLIGELKEQIQSREAQLEGGLGRKGFEDTKLPSIGQALDALDPNTNELQLGIIQSPAQFLTLSPTHELQAGATALTDNLLRTHLPPQPPTDFIGRRDEINELVNATEVAVMIAVTGVLGIGKTSLLRVAAARLDPCVKLRITEAWDENNEHSTNSTHYEARGADLPTSDMDGNKFGRPGRLAVNASFDWVLYENSSHIHVSMSK